MISRKKKKKKKKKKKISTNILLIHLLANIVRNSLNQVGVMMSMISNKV